MANTPPAEENTDAVEASVEADLDPKLIAAATGGASAAFMRAALEAICGKAPSTALTAQWLQLHSATPGNTGASPTGVARQQLVWGAASGGDTVVASISATALTFSNVPPGTYSHYGLWTAVTGGTFLYGKPLSTPVTIPAGATGTITVTASHTYDIN